MDWGMLGAGHAGDKISETHKTEDAPRSSPTPNLLIINDNPTLICL
jgi:hypothetical protein